VKPLSDQAQAFAAGRPPSSSSPPTYRKCGCHILLAFCAKRVDTTNLNHCAANPDLTTKLEETAEIKPSGPRAISRSERQQWPEDRESSDPTHRENGEAWGTHLTGKLEKNKGRVGHLKIFFSQHGTRGVARVYVDLDGFAFIGIRPGGGLVFVGKITAVVASLLLWIAVKIS
jgi:hypothetical protein